MRWYVAVAISMLAISAAAFDAEHWIQVKGGAWEPPPAVLAELEATLKPAVGPAAQNRGRIPPWTEYTFQYQGRATLLGRKFVYVNAFCRQQGRSLDREWVTVLDGGACFFSAKYDPGTKRIYDIAVNGVA
jgi:hypothetical protein